MIVGYTHVKYSLLISVNNKHKLILHMVHSSESAVPIKISEATPL